MTTLLLVFAIFAVAWVHAKLSVVHAIYVTVNADQMMWRMHNNTVWWCVITLLVHMVFTWGWLLLAYHTVRFLILLMVDWHAVCAGYTNIKRLIN